MYVECNMRNIIKKIHPEKQMSTPHGMCIVKRGLDLGFKEMNNLKYNGQVCVKGTNDRFCQESKHCISPAWHCYS